MIVTSEEWLAGEYGLTAAGRNAEVSPAILIRGYGKPMEVLSNDFR
jgi:hypothetical protein